jgi:hypothetical protein
MCEGSTRTSIREQQKTSIVRVHVAITHLM